MGDGPFSNKEKIERVKKHLYNNNLPEKEIDKIFTEFSDSTFEKGFDCGVVVEKNIAKRIEQAKVKTRNNSFEKIFEELEEEQSKRTPKKK